MRRVLANMPGQPAPIKQLLIRDRARAYFIPVDSIERLSAAGNYVEIHAGGKVHLVREPLAKLAAQLDAREFVRVHRAHVVGRIGNPSRLTRTEYQSVLPRVGHPLVNCSSNYRWQFTAHRGEYKGRPQLSAFG